MIDDCERILFNSEQIENRVGEIAKELNKKFKGERPVCVCILKGAVIFFADLVRRLDFDVKLDFMAVSSYGNGTVSSGALNIKKDLSENVKWQDVILVEDIIDSGYTLACLKKLMIERGAKSVTIVTLLDKAACRTSDVTSDYNGFKIEDEFVVGYGLDYAERFRNLPYIGVLNRSVYEK
ncbi:MAG: hypoxanthine phosphoribosyltransferase [Candidatus Coproplasma sp.]